MLFKIFQQKDKVCSFLLTESNTEKKLINFQHKGNTNSRPEMFAFIIFMKNFVQISAITNLLI